MSREPFDQALVDEFERELREALAIEPSPVFARKVRERIASRPSRSSWTVGLAAAAVCVLAVGLGMWINRQPAEECHGAVPGCQSAGRSRDVQLNPSEIARQPHATFEVARAPRPLSTMRHRNVRPIPEPTPEPEVIVPPDRALALARFLELARQGAVTEETLKPVASAASPALLEIQPLDVALIAVPEIETPTGSAERGADRE